jgi:hypothetical protein
MTENLASVFELAQRLKQSFGKIYSSTWVNHLYLAPHTGVNTAIPLNILRRVIVPPLKIRYLGSMDTLPDPKPGRIWLVLAPGPLNEALLDLAARLAVHSRLHIIDGGNRFSANRLIRSLTRCLEDSARRGEAIRSLTSALDSIHLARAFTCYQMYTLLAETPSGNAPVLVLDLLATFYDEDVRLPESLRLLKGCLVELKRLAEHAPIVIGSQGERILKTGSRPELLQTLHAAADRVWIFEPREPFNPQIGLF